VRKTGYHPYCWFTGACIRNFCSHEIDTIHFASRIFRPFCYRHFLRFDVQITRNLTYGIESYSQDRVQIQSTIDYTISYTWETKVRILSARLTVECTFQMIPFHAHHFSIHLLFKIRQKKEIFIQALPYERKTYNKITPRLNKLRHNPWNCQQFWRWVTGEVRGYEKVSVLSLARRGWMWNISEAKQTDSYRSNKDSSQCP
jgi:hypothetical protein